ncbi:ABC-three component system middle component 6 [Streptomyces rubiginosohelvolus]|uniref:ABC-three component system middle component 6 n=1 Tax=Streptomyces TaxID=1883 RepID=UPI003329533C
MVWAAGDPGMITPTKGIAPDRALLAVGAQILLQLDEPRSVSQAWARLRKWRTDHGHHAPVSFAWFVLALDVLYSLGAVELRRDVLVARSVDAAALGR